MRRSGMGHVMSPDAEGGIGDVRIEVELRGNGADGRGILLTRELAPEPLRDAPGRTANGKGILLSARPLPADRGCITGGKHMCDAPAAWPGVDHMPSTWRATRRTSADDNSSRVRM
ncbi:hypothetical protein Q4543_17425 [Salipiger sp. 1_MG-2023]|uniref:hypothetical protein n=1 Tax=Salipiger sp. 1_MG-2023 TaxID=3062665 RepID=UPI0026E24D32|nr:hypothetical protein [Salipiger sp. 1_MG-2023]MDO6587297.1 hypothetical protein [Salipiger sp. 1_MG-2023]